MAEKGFCQCGCGQRTNIPKRTDRRKNQIKGQPMRFLRGHISKIKHPALNGGRIFDGRYWRIHAPGHPRANTNGYVWEHIIIAEKALGKSLPNGTEVHHFPNRINFTHIVICENSPYHNLLHRRQTAFFGCGHPSWRKCSYCKQWDAPENLIIAKYGQVYHAKCQREYRRSHVSVIQTQRSI